MTRQPSWTTPTLRWIENDWDHLLVHLSGLIRQCSGREGRFLIVAQDSPHRFVQFATTDRGITAEAISNEFLGPRFKLPSGAVTRLKKLGWKPPSRSCPNFHCQRPRNEEPAALALLAVRTLRDVFRLREPRALKVKRASFDDAGAGGQKAEDVAPHCFSVAPGTRFQNVAFGSVYEVGRRLGAGGFGTAYVARQVAGRPRRKGHLCLKLSDTPEAWHREAYFGQLLVGVPGAIAVFDSFAAVQSAPGAQEALWYCLVTELAEQGDLATYLAGTSRGWSEARVCRETVRILRVLVQLHDAGAVHRDITINNVFVTRRGTLKLGDFGIARHRRGTRAVRADMFAEHFAPTALIDAGQASWRTSDDVYQVGMMMVALLWGNVTEKPTIEEVRMLSCSPWIKEVIQRAIGERRKRFKDATAMLAALRSGGGRRARVARVTSLQGKELVFTGVLSISRREAVRQAVAVGATVKPRVSASTDIVVLGAAATDWKAESKGQKMLDVDREAELGHSISVIGERAFLAAVVRTAKQHVR